MVARLLLVSSLLWPAVLAMPAAADSTSVVVLGLRSIEGDDRVANDITLHLREGASSIEGWSVSPTSVSMAQMSLAHGCDELDAACLAEIAKGLQADRIIYGTLHRKSTRPDFEFSLGVNLYDAEQASIVRQVEHPIPNAQSDYDNLRAHAMEVLKRLSAPVEGGTIAVEVNVQGATVMVNGQSVGLASDGTLRLEGLQEGQYHLEISKAGYVPHKSSVTIAAGTETVITAQLNELQTAAVVDQDYASAAPSGHNLGWLGWTLVGVSGASLIGMTVSMLRVSAIDDDTLLNRYRDAVAEGNARAREQGTTVYADVCLAADRGLEYGLERADIQDISDLCAEADTWEVLQWVFLGTAVAAGGAGAYLLLTERPSGAEADGAQARASQRPSLSIVPFIGRDSAHVNATLRF